MGAREPDGRDIRALARSPEDPSRRRLCRRQAPGEPASSRRLPPAPRPPLRAPKQTHPAGSEPHARRSDSDECAETGDGERAESLMDPGGRGSAPPGTGKGSAEAGRAARYFRPPRPAALRPQAAGPRGSWSLGCFLWVRGAWSLGCFLWVSLPPVSSKDPSENPLAGDAQGDPVARSGF